MSTLLQLGNPLLRHTSRPITLQELYTPSFLSSVSTLKQTLVEFRATSGFGRAIAMPQIGIATRVVALHLEHISLPSNPSPSASLRTGLQWTMNKPIALINPIITWKSPETFHMFDDCLCFPDKLVRVKRHCSVSLEFTDESTGEVHVFERLPINESELIQHELDHLDGVLAVDLAEDPAVDIISRVVFEQNKAEYLKTVDYHIA
ncbi:UNVERIFIED_CONTAM: hypothetical protein HDU68_007779 [Siphonaria sp. JEL0065]|nr:hypothetical protein HDU68_007779 [Siphonaria sp. JEL0065]